MSNEYCRWFQAAALTLGSFAVVHGAWAQDATLKLRGSGSLVTTDDTWSGDGWFNIGGMQLPHAKVTYTTTGYEKDEGDTMIGSEVATVQFATNDFFAPKDSFQLKCTFVLENMTNTTGVFRIFETCNVVNGTGAFANAAGLVADVGTFGPAASFANVKGDSDTWYCASEYDGVITGFDLDAFMKKVNASPKARVTLLLRNVRRPR